MAKLKKKEKKYLSNNMNKKNKNYIRQKEIKEYKVLVE